MTVRSIKPQVAETGSASAFLTMLPAHAMQRGLGGRRSSSARRAAVQS
jgi:hypothetical protein